MIDDFRRCASRGGLSYATLAASVNYRPARLSGLTRCIIYIPNPRFHLGKTKSFSSMPKKELKIFTSTLLNHYLCERCQSLLGIRTFLENSSQLATVLT